jgi:hypothetical protein
MQELECQVFGDDGVFWLIFAPCAVHGLEGEHTPVYSPRIDLDIDKADTDQVPAEQEAFQ